MIDFGREICSNPQVATSREWLVTNGIGGYGSGTVSGVLTRRYHGLLVAALKPPLGRTLLLTKFDEIATYDGQPYALYANQWTSDRVDAPGLAHLERFHLEGTTPTWTYAFADALLVKQVWMEQGANTTYVTYTPHHGTAPIVLTLKALVNYRDHHANTRAPNWQTKIEPVDHGLAITAFDGATPFYLRSDRAQAEPQHEWYRDYFLAIEAERGQDDVGDHLLAGTFGALLEPGQSFTIVASTESAPNLNGQVAYTRHFAAERQRIASTSEPIQPLVLAADQFIVKRPSSDDPNGRSIIAGYPWFGDWGRDTMISLPGLTLTTDQPEVARRILHTFARFIDQGMLPNRFPDAGETPEYNTVDATLWYFEAIRAYHAATDDDALLAELFPALQEIIAWHIKGTRYRIHADPADGLLYAGEPGIQLTWMDAKIGDWVVTPRTGKAIEINALWHNALRVTAEIAQRLGKPDQLYVDKADQVQASFGRFWNPGAGYCYDVLDGPNGNDFRLRPNQLFAVSLPHRLLSDQQARAVVDVCARKLLTSYGLRSLSPDDPDYAGHYGGDQKQRDSVYHQGTVWAWLIGPFVSAHLRVYQDRDAARSYLKPLIQHLAEHSMGTLSEIFDGDPPFTPRGCFAQAWSVAEVLRAWEETD
ncbi:MAG: amylo-alpha-1,6-glucosidase [Aggregatilineales bacterium]